MPGHPEETVVRAAESPVGAWLGIETIGTSEGEAILHMPTRREMGDSAQAVHGGFIALLADSAMARAMGTVPTAGGRHYDFDLKLNFIAAGRIGEHLRAVARVLHSGRRTGVAECRVEGEDGRLVATATASFIVNQPESQRADVD
jgi:acyl-CoA thioesterase